MNLRSPLIAALALLLLPVAAGAATVEGRLVNGTQGGDASAESVVLLDTAAGMREIGRLSDVTGSFRFEDVPEDAASHYLLQAVSDGTTYSEIVNLSGEVAQVEVAIYETTGDETAVSISLYHAIFQRDGQHLNVTELLEFRNDTQPPRRVWRPGGTIRVHLPHEIHGEVSASVGSGGMPVRHELLPLEGNAEFAVDAPLAPGQTRVVLRYAVEYPGDRLHWEPTLHYPVGERSVLVSPPDIQVTGPGLEPGSQPVQGHAVFVGGPLQAGASFPVDLAGGSMNAADPHAGHGGSQIERVDIVPNRLQASRWPIMLVLAALLVLGSVVGLRAGADAEVAGAADLQGKLLRLEDRFIIGELGREAFEKEREQLLEGARRRAAKKAARD